MTLCKAVYKLNYHNPGEGKQITSSFTKNKEVSSANSFGLDLIRKYK